MIRALAMIFRVVSVLEATVEAVFKLHFELCRDFYATFIVLPHPTISLHG